jgi:CheY-like chemotaxis protein
VVDDEPPVRHLLTRWLEGWGYSVKEAGSATEALELMILDPASIVLCDIRMPVHDGLWLLERLRGQWPATAVIMATGLDDLQTVTRAHHLGAVDYVVKPFGREMLLQALQRAEAWRVGQSYR